GESRIAEQRFHARLVAEIPRRFHAHARDLPLLADLGERHLQLLVGANQPVHASESLLELPDGVEQLGRVQHIDNPPVREVRAHRGTVRPVLAVVSTQLGKRRDLLVYTPASYARGTTRYPVIYMQDGQNLFDAATSFAGDWGLKTALAWASRRGLEAIVVGIPNMGVARIDEYTPFMDPKAGGGQGERYLDYLVHTVKPLIDERFRTLPERAHTGIAGSSLGGLISLYAFFRYPEVFGFTAALSPSLWFANAAILAFVEQATPPAGGRVYLDRSEE